MAEASPRTSTATLRIIGVLTLVLIAVFAVIRLAT